MTEQKKKQTTLLISEAEKQRDVSYLNLLFALIVVAVIRQSM